MPVVLIIEDEEQMRTLLKIQLKRMGFDSIEAGNGLEGIKMAQAKKPNLILCDLMMPVAEGDFVLGFIRSTPDLKNTPIIVTSAHPRAQVIAQQLGANYCLPKPFSMTELENAIEQVAIPG